MRRRRGWSKAELMMERKADLVSMLIETREELAEAKESKSAMLSTLMHWLVEMRVVERLQQLEARVIGGDDGE